MMRFGFYLPTRGPTATRTGLLTMLEAGERFGFDAVMVADHVVIPETVESAYPYTVSGAFVGDEEAMEQLSLMSFVAGVTERLRIVASVMIVPHRNPVVTAKMLSTIDVLSDGRLTVGVGVGWMREEFEALAAPDFAARGRVTDEYIDIFRTLWREHRPSYEGEYYRFAPLKFAPKPIQQPGPPIWVGGHSGPALRRVARLGDGWHPVGSTAASPLPPDEVREKKGRILDMATAEGRDASAIEVSYKAPIYDGGQPPEGETRRAFSGGVEDILDDIGRFDEAGVDELVFDFRSETTARTVERMQWFAEDVRARCTR